MGHRLVAALYWFYGVLSASFTVLLVALVLVAEIYGIYPKALSGPINAWLAVSFAIAFLPAPFIVSGFTSEQRVEELSEGGCKMFFRYNLVAGALWLLIFSYRYVLVPIGGWFLLNAVKRWPTFALVVCVLLSGKRS